MLISIQPTEFKKNQLSCLPAQTVDNRPIVNQDYQVQEIALRCLETARHLHELSLLYPLNTCTRVYSLNDRQNPKFAKVQKFIIDTNEKIKALFLQDGFTTINTIKKFTENLLSESIATKRLNVLSPICSILKTLFSSENYVEIQNPVFNKFGLVCLTDTSTHKSHRNVISRTELKEMEALYKQLIAPGCNIIIKNPDNGFKPYILNEFARLLTFPEGRKFIKEVLSVKETVTIQAGLRNSYSMARGNFISIIYTPETNSPASTNTKSTYYGTYGNRKFSYKRPTAFSLYHELIHFLHSTKKFASSEQFIRENPTFNMQFWTNAEEVVTIKEVNGLLSARTFWPERIYHQRGSNFERSFNEEMERALRYGIDGDVEALIRREIDQKNEVNIELSLEHFPSAIKDNQYDSIVNLLLNKEIQDQTTSISQSILRHRFSRSRLTLDQLISINFNVIDKRVNNLKELVIFFIKKYIIKYRKIYRKKYRKEIFSKPLLEKFITSIKPTIDDLFKKYQNKKLRADQLIYDLIRSVIYEKMKL